MLPRFIKVFPHEFKRVLGVRPKVASRIFPGQNLPGQNLPGENLPVVAAVEAGAAMGKTTGFMEHERELPTRRPVTERVNDWFEIYQDFPEAKLRVQGGALHGLRSAVLSYRMPREQHHSRLERSRLSRSMEKTAVRQLHATKQFSGVHGGAFVPAPCEAAWRARHQSASGYDQADRKRVSSNAVLKRGWIRPEAPRYRTGKKVAVVGSGPAGLAAAQQLCRSGHAVHCVRGRRIASAVCFDMGIPQFKLEKHIVDRRLAQMEAEGVRFVTNAHVGNTTPVENLQRNFDAIVLAGGSEQPRDLKVPGRDLKGIHFAMEFLPQQKPALRGATCLNLRLRYSRYWKAGRHRWRRRYGRRLSWDLPSGKSRGQCTSSRSCRCRRTSVLRRPLGRCGRCNYASKVRMKKVASGTGALPPPAFTGDSKGKMKQLHAISRWTSTEVRGPIHGNGIHSGCRPGIDCDGLPGPSA